MLLISSTKFLKDERPFCKSAHLKTPVLGTGSLVLEFHSPFSNHTSNFIVCSLTLTHRQRETKQFSIILAVNSP